MSNFTEHIIDRYSVDQLTDGYGVIATHTNTDASQGLVVICKSQKNAELIALILNHDKDDEVCNDYCVDDIVDTANGNVLGYLDERFHPKIMAFDQDGIDAFHVTMKGFGRVSQLAHNEIRAILDMKATKKVVINRKFGPIILWSAEICSTTIK